MNSNETDDVQRYIEEVCDSLKETLKRKNKSYGNSALNPKRIFSKASTVEQICVRIDDKINRIMSTGINGSFESEDAVADLMGYLVLLQVRKKMDESLDVKKEP